ncbi:S1C family serine protease [Streptomyces cynarae]|uniref:S1C family serine protease n=1 Tax=Streptomyces cynarae TaxID=2981134 RepID=UPI00406CA2F2
MTETFRHDSEYDSTSGHGHQPASPQQHASSPLKEEWPPPPAYEPAVGHGSGGGGGAESRTAAPAGPVPRKRPRGPVALLVAVAIVAAATGGGAAYGVQQFTGGKTSVSTRTDVVPSSAEGTIATVVAAVNPSVVEIKATSSCGESIGSGVIISGDGQIITNNHVISGASSIKVRTSSGTSYTARVVGTDSKKGLAVLKLQGASGLKAATLGDSDGLQVGDQVVAIGSPEGLSDTVTSGIVSALNRDVTVPTDNNQQQGQGNGLWPFWFGGRQFNGDTGPSTTTYKAIQADTPLNPGNSGGALIDMNGNVIGINSAMYSPGSDSTSSSAGSIGLGFAIPINTVKSDLATLRPGSQA